MLKKNLAYFAGFFDGEGCIVIGNTKHILQCSITSTTKWILELFRFNFNGSVSKKMKFHPSNRHDIYRWYSTGPTARIFLEAILPYLQIKRPEAEVAIRFQLRKEGMHYPRTGHPIPNSERILREADRILLQKMKEQVKGGFNNLELEPIEEKENDQLSLL